MSRAGSSAQTSGQTTAQTFAQTPARTPADGPEAVRLWRDPALPGATMLAAGYRRQTFPRHTHDGYALGVIERGALGFRYRGENLVAPAGSVNLVVPDEPHDGHPAADEGWTYRMFYLDPARLVQAVAEIDPKSAGLPHFRPGVLFDAALAAEVRDLHTLLAQVGVPSLVRQSGLTALLSAWVRRHAERPPQPPTLREPGRIRRLRDYIRENCGQDISLTDLTELSGLSGFHLIRTFAAQTGLTPHAWLIQSRVTQAARLLVQDSPIADIAVAVGFADQSHLTRHFKRLTGLTPAAYRNFLQDSRP